MPRRTWILGACVVSLLAAGAAVYRFTPTVPAIVKQLRLMPEVARIEHTGPADARRTIVHFRDVHIPSHEDARQKGQDYPALLEKMADVQNSQMWSARRLIKAHDINALYVGGLTREALPDLKLRLEVLRGIIELPPIADQPTQAAQQLALEVGTPGRLWLFGAIEHLLPLEDEAALKNAPPFKDGKAPADDAALEARRRAIVRSLPDAGIVLMVLDGSHDLTPYLPADTLYVRVTPTGYPEE